MRFVFLHGGPGFNSFAEQAILGPIFHSYGREIVFWNEPSRLRPGGERHRWRGSGQLQAQAERRRIAQAH